MARGVKTGGRPPWPQEKQNLLAEMYTRGDEWEDIVAAVGYSYSNCKAQRRRMGVPVRKAKRVLRKLWSIKKADEPEFRRMWSTGVKRTAIMERFGIKSHTTMQAVRVRLGLPARNRGSLNLPRLDRNDILFSFHINVLMNRAMHRRARERQTSVAEYVRYLIARDNGL